jgi:hypothetical protein
MNEFPILDEEEAVLRLENGIFANNGSKMVAQTKKDLTAKG